MKKKSGFRGMIPLIWNKKCLRIMRLTILFLFVGLMQVSASLYSQNTKLNLDFHNTSVLQVLEAIENQSEFRFAYSPKYIDMERKVDVEIKDKSIEQTLSLLFNGTDVNYSISDRHILLFIANEQAKPAQQKKSVSGKVTDSSGTTLPGVSVVVKGTTLGVITDMDGKYSLSNLPENATLQFTFVGMKSQEIVVGEKTIIDIKLEDQTVGIEEVVAVGYGIQKKRDVTGSVISIKSEQFQNAPQTTIAQSLQGKMAGVQISQTSSSAEGNSNQIQIRGVRSITAGGSPLIVVDGIPYSGILSEINPNDIESIEVLKDASSAAIYGARAANGVILISTKKGLIGKTTVSYEGYYGLDVMAHTPEMMSAQEFYNFKVARKGVSSITIAEQQEYAKGTDTDWLALATRTGKREQHNISVSGGSENTKYFFSGSANKTQGLAQNDDFNRYTFRINIESAITSWLKIGTSTQLGYFGRNGEPANFASAMTTNPLNVPYNADGTINFTPWAGDTFIKNPLEPLVYTSEDVARSAVSNNFLQIDFPFLKGLTYRVNCGYNYRYRLYELYVGRNTLTGSQLGGQMQVNNEGKEDWTLENIVTYNKTFGKHTVGFTGLYSAQQYTEKFHDLTATGFPADYMTYYQSKVATSWAPTDSYTKTATISQMARLNYNFSSKYLLTMTARRDGFSAFGTDTKFGIFPSVALGWNVNEESFLKSIVWIDRVKLRVSYGVNGNQAISAYSTLPTMSGQNFLDNNEKPLIGFYPNKLGDPVLGWETTRSFNIGLDHSFLKGRLSGTIDAYSTATENLLLNCAIPQINGVGSITKNIGKTTGQGIELQLSSINVRTKDFSWTTDLNLSFQRSQIRNVGSYDANGNPTDNIANNWFIGKPIGVIYGYAFDGIWQAGDNIASSWMPTAKPGDVKIKDISGPNGVPDNKIDVNDRTILGKTNPDMIGGITNTFQYKAITFSFFINAVKGITKYTDYNSTWVDGRYNMRFRTWWTADNPINTYPANREDSNPYGAGYFGNTNDGSFIRLSNVTLAYKFSPILLKKLKMNNLEVYVNAKNLATLTHFIGLDPELSSDYAVPFSRSFLVGIRFNL